MRLAVISDVHGNVAALETVLAELEQEPVDQLVCLGDIAVGPRPHETVSRIRELGCPVVMGNWDEWFIDGIPELGGEVGPRLVEQGIWWAQQLTDADREFMRSFPRSVELSLGPGTGLLCFHGSPSSLEDGIEAETTSEELDLILDGQDATVFLCGHTHLQLLRDHRGSLVANPGSVGLPFRSPVPSGAVRVSPWAEYGVVTSTDAGVAMEFRRTRYDVQAVLREVLESGVPYADWWASCWETNA